MSDDFNKYYKEYHKGEHAYKLEAAKDTSRVKIIKEMLETNLKSGAKVLDVGCGDGYFKKIMPQFDWHGIDIAPHKGAESWATTHDLMETPYPYDQDTFHGFVCSEVLEHVFDLRKVHAEVCRIGKPGALYVVSTPNFNHIDHFFSQFNELIFNPAWTHHMEHIRFYDHTIHKKLLQEAGFKVNEIVGADAHFSRSLQDARASLVKQGKAKDLWEADVILGKCFPFTSHTVILRANKLLKVEVSA